MATLSRIQRGTPLRRAVTSDLLNALIDRYNGVDLDRASGAFPRPPSIVRCSNATGTDLDAGAAVSLSFLAATRERIPGLVPPSCVARSSELDGVRAVLLEPVPAGMEGRAVVAGVAVALVHVGSASHRYCRFVQGHVMSSCDVGEAEAQIIVPHGTGATMPTGTGLCLVSLWGIPPSAIDALRMPMDFRVDLSPSGWTCRGGWVIWPQGVYQVQPATGTSSACIYLSLTSSSGSIQTASSMPNPSFTGGTLTLPLADVELSGGKWTLLQHRAGDVLFGDTPAQWVHGYQVGSRKVRAIGTDGYEIYLPIADCDGDEEQEE